MEINENKVCHFYRVNPIYGIWPPYIIHLRAFCESMVKDAIHVLYKHSAFQSVAQTCLVFSQIQPQNMLKIYLSKNIEKSKFMI